MWLKGQKRWWNRGCNEIGKFNGQRKYIQGNNNKDYIIINVSVLELLILNTKM